MEAAPFQGVDALNPVGGLGIPHQALPVNRVSGQTYRAEPHPYRAGRGFSGKSPYQDKGAGQGWILESQKGLRRINQQMPKVRATSMNQKEFPGGKNWRSGCTIKTYPNDAIAEAMATKHPTSNPARTEIPFINFPTINPVIKAGAAPITTNIPKMIPPPVVKNSHMMNIALNWTCDGSMLSSIHNP